jgi:peptide/nickel transport system permease protein
VKRFASRLAGIVVVILAATSFAWWILHLLRPNLFPAESGGLIGRYGHFLDRAFLHFDFGDSSSGSRRPVADLVREGAPADISVLAGGLVFGLAAGVAGGVACARRPRGVVSRALQGVGLVGMCTPVYVVGLMALLLFGAEIGRVQPLGLGIPLRYVGFGDSATGWLAALIAPWMVLGLPLAGMCLRVMQGQMLEVAGEEYVDVARAKGLSEARIRRRHMLPPALAPTLMLAGSSTPLLLTNVVLVEKVFSIPGVFRDLSQAYGGANIPLILGMTAVGAAFIGVTTLLFDLALAWLDPRIRAGQAAR